MKRTPPLIILSFILLWASPSAAASSLLDELKKERERIDEQIKETTADHENLADGLIKSLMESRLEILKISSELVRQRINVIESDAKITLKASGQAPDPKKAEALRKDIRDLEDKLEHQIAERDKYAGGLVRAMLESTISISRMNVSILETEYLKAKYGIYWIPSLNSTSDIVAQGIPTTEPVQSKRQKSTASRRTALPVDKELIIPKLANKRFRKADWMNGIYEDAVLFDVHWDTSKLKKDTIAIKGVLVFSDLFEEEKFRIRWTIDDPIRIGIPFVEKNVGFTFNQFSDAHRWIQSTDLSKMLFRFDITEILYADGTKGKY